MSPRPRVAPRAAAMLPTGSALAVALVAVGAVCSAPIGLLERLVWTSGIATLMPLAQPPLGMTARILLALGAGVAAGAVVWSALYLLVGPGGLFGPRLQPSGLASESSSRRPARVRRGDAHPDAPPPRPMTAADLGTPLMEVEPPRVQPLPADLDQPLAAFDPGALPATPLEPSRPVAALATPRWREGERIETFALEVPPAVALVGKEPPVRAGKAPQPSIDSLLRRLEEGAGRRLAVR